MPSSGDFYVDEINHEERFSVYVKTSWDIFSETIQEIKNVALDKSEANPEYSGKVATGVDITVKAAGTIAGINILCIFRNYGIPKLKPKPSTYVSICSVLVNLLKYGFLKNEPLIS